MNVARAKTWSQVDSPKRSFPAWWWALALAGVWASGCGGCQAPVESSLALDFIQPTEAQVLTFGDDVDASTPGLQYDVKLLARDTSGRAVTLASAKLETRSASVETWTDGPAAALDGAAANFPAVALDSGAQVLRATVVEQGSNRTVMTTVHVDVQTTRPVVTAVAFQGDANSDHRLNATELPSGAPVALITTGGLEDGQPVRVLDKVGGTVLGESTSTGNKASVTLSGLGVTATTEADYALVVEVTGKSGKTNKLASGTPSDPLNDAAFTTLRVDRVLPVVTITSPVNQAHLSLSDDGNPNLPDFQVRLAFTVPADVKAGGVQVVHAPGGTTQPAPAAGAVVEDITVPWSNGEATFTFTVTATDESGNVGAVKTVSATVAQFITVARVISGDGQATDFAPTVTPLKFVASTNSHLFNNGNHTGYVVDKVAGGNADTDLEFTLAYSAGASAEVIYNGAAVSAAKAVGGPGVIAFNNVVLPQRSSGPLGVRVFMANGAEARFTVDAAVDVQPPSQSPVTFNLVTASPFSNRNPALDVSWPASNDDGETASGSPVGYDVRWTTDAIAPAGIDSELRFYDQNATQQVTGALLPVAVRNVRLPNLPTIGRYYVQARAVDAMGNYAPFSTPAAVDHFLTEQAFPSPAVSTNKFGNNIVANGSLNNDGIDDLVVSETVVSQPGHVYVIYGASNLATATVQTLSPPDAISQFYGSSISVGNAGDPAAGPAKADLLVTSQTWNNRGRALLYFGQSAAPTLNPTDTIEFRGNGGSFGGAAKILDDLNGDGYGEILISASGENAPLGRVYMFNGRTREAWLALRVTDPSDNALVVTTAQADRVFDGPAFSCATERPLSASLCPTPTNPSLYFGRRNGFASLGDVNGDGVGDFTIGQSRDFVNRLFVHSGASGNTTPVQKFVLDDPSVPMSPGSSLNLAGYAAEAFGKVNLIGNSSFDLATSYPSANRVYLYAGGGSPVPFAGAPTVLRGSGSYGWTLAHGDINGDGREDLVIGSNNSLAAGGEKGSAYILFNTGVSGAEFDLGAGSAIGTGQQGFHQSRLTGTQAMGVGVAVGDFNGDGVKDVAASDWLEGCTVQPPAGAEQCSANPGKVIIRY